MALGQPTVPPLELIFTILAKEFGTTPDVIAEKPADEVLLWWQLTIDLQPKQPNMPKAR